MNLEDRIKNRTTELQQSYDWFLVLRDRSMEKIESLEKQIEEEKAELKSICKSIRKCHDRAIEQGHPNVLK